MKNKKLCKMISAVTTAAILGTGSIAGTSILSASAATAGDANGDGKLGIEDVVALGNYLVGRSDTVSMDADMNNDSILNVFDLVLVKRAAIKAGITDTNFIHLKGSSITTEGSNMVVSGSKVTITASGTYYVDGTLSDGQIEVSVPDIEADPETVKIFLNGVNITGASAPAIYIENAENTSINLVEGTVNTLSDGTTAYEGDFLEKAVLQADDDMTIKGDGALNITANTQYAIHCNNDLKLNGGNLNITTVAGDAVRGKKSVTVKDGNIVIDSAGDGIKSTKGSVDIKGGTINIKAENDAVQSETTLTVSDGTLFAYGKRSLTAGADCTVDITGGSVVATSNEEFTNTAGIKVNSMILNYTEKLDKSEISIKNGAAEVYTVKPGKKYTYAMICNAALADGTYNVYTGGAQMTHAAAKAAGEFVKSGTVSAFDSVAAIDGSSTVTPSTDGNTITLGSSGINFSGTGAAVSADKKTVTISQPGTYSVTGEMEGGQIVVDVDKTTYADATVELSLEGMSLTNTIDSPIYVASVDDKCSISAKNGTVNTISDGTAAYTNADGGCAAIYSKDDLTFKGKGTLIVNGNYQDAIVGKDDIKINNGTLQVNAVDDGIRGKDSVRIGDPADTDFSKLNVTVTTKSGDGIKSSSTDAATDSKTYGIVTVNGGTINIDAYSDGIQGEQEVVINGGDINIKTYEGSSFTGSGSSSGSTGSNPWGGGMGGMNDGNTNKTDVSAKGIKAVGLYDESGTTWQSGGNITINGGTIVVDASDDSIHCGGNIAVNGGELKLATADDGLHADHDITLGKQGGSNDDFNIYVSKCYEGVEGQNIYQYSGTVLVKADDDGYNAAGGADGSGTTGGPGGGWNQGGGFGSAGNNELTIAGGVAIVQSASGDHDAMDSNGNLTITGGLVIANGNEPLDCDGTNSAAGGTVIAASQGSTVAANTQFTIADASGNVIVSFKTMQAMGSITVKHSDTTVTAYTGGTISNGKNLITTDSSQNVYASGTISGGSTVNTSTGGGNTGGPGGRF